MKRDKDSKQLMAELAKLAPTNEAADILGLTRRQIRNLAEDGTLDAIKIGADWWIYRDSIKTYPNRKSPRGRKPKSEQTT